ncbi:MAG TPA: type II secretion system major pseudopilin GspG [Anaeromyxobacteraceae bacterium]|nr:type II secretion system major pseudopilin GspG [Anaeromyxobacteraceae bacterium]
MNVRTLRPLRAAPRGMTLIEILVVLVIIGLIATAVAVNVVGAGEKARVDRAKADVQRIASEGVEAYKVMRGRFPTTEEGLDMLVKEKFLKANSKDGKLLDPWNRPYVYLYPGQDHPDSFDVKSYGADGQPGGEGESADITNY